MFGKITLFLGLAVGTLSAQTAPVSGYCTLGGSAAKVSGLSSTNYLQGIVPSCTVTVYLTGTTTKATIYADGNNTPLSNPFTANNAASTNPGGWLFYASQSAALDVVLSGGIAPNTYPNPITVMADVLPGSGTGGPFCPLSGCTFTGPLNAPIYDRGGQVYDIRNYGAVCDGVTDDSVHILAAQNAAGSTGVVLIPPQKTCMGQVTVSIVGQTFSLGNGSVLKNPNASGATLTVTANNVTITGQGAIDGNIGHADPVACGLINNLCGALQVNGASNVIVQGITLQNSLFYNIYAADAPYLTIQNTYGYNAGFHSYVIQMTKAPVDGSDSIKGLRIVNNVVNTTGNTSPNKDSFQIFGYFNPTTRTIYWQDSVTFTGNTSILCSAYNVTDPVCQNTSSGLGDRVEFAYLRNSTLSNNTTHNGRLGLSVNRSQSVTIAGNAVYGISETGYEEIANTGATWSSNTCVGGIGRCFGGGIWVVDGTQSQNVVVNGMTSTGMTGGGVALYYAINPTLRGMQLEVANSGAPKYQCVLLSWTIHAEISGLQCNGTSTTGTTYGIILADSVNATISNSHFNYLLNNNITVNGDNKGPGGFPFLVSTSSTGGSLPNSTTYYAKVEADCGAGNTIGTEGSATSSSGTGNTAYIDWAWSPVSCATSYKLWVGTTPGGENTYFTTTNAAFQQTAATGTAGSIATSPTSTAIGNIVIANNHTNGNNTLVAGSYSGGASGGSTIITSNNTNDKLSTKHTDYVDFTNSVTLANSIFGSNPAADNNTDAPNAVNVIAGKTAPQITQYNLRDYLNNLKFHMGMDASFNFFLFDDANSLGFLSYNNSGQLQFNSRSTQPIQTNGGNGSSTGGLQVKSGGAVPAIVDQFLNTGASLGPSIAAYGNLTMTAVSTPTNATFTTATSGGTCLDTTNYYYRVAALNSNGTTLASTETSITTGASGSNINTVTVKWVGVIGATSYKVYGRSTGAELLIGTVSSNNTNSFVDDCTVTPSGALPAANTTVGLAALAGGASIGSSGSTIGAEYKGTGTLTYTAISAQTCQDQPLTITGSASGDQCSASPASDIGANLSNAGCRISASNTAQIRVCNPTTGSLTPAAVSWTGWAVH